MAGAALGALALAGVMLPHAAAAAEREFVCPHLESNTLRSEGLIMSQAKDGFFLRMGGDLNDDFFFSRDTLKYFGRLAAALERNDATLVYLPVPTRGMAVHDRLIPDAPKQAFFDMESSRDNYREFAAALRATGVVVPNLLEVLEADEQRAEAFFGRDHHWTPTGAKIFAKGLQPLFDELPALEGIDRIEFETVPSGQREMLGTLMEKIQSQCESQIPTEVYQAFETRRAGDNLESNLFGGSDEGRVILLGTSYSQQTAYNFDGFLSQYSGFDVENYAVSGGHLFGSILSYMSSVEFVEEPPSVILWEAPIYYKANRGGKLAFRQVIPAVFGECDESQAISTAALTVEQQKPVELFKIDASAGVGGTNYFMFLETSNIGLTHLNLKIKYDDGDVERFAIDRTEADVNSGRFFVEFSGDIESNVVSVELESFSEVTAPVNARICRSPMATPSKTAAIASQTQTN